MEAPLAESSLGSYRGRYVHTLAQRPVVAFNGIRYAKPPLGTLRFKEAERIDAHDGVYNATQDGDDAVQPTNSYSKYPRAPIQQHIYVGSEDCLFLNIYTPQVDREKGYPVMVYIHGGGYTKGTASYNFHGPQMLLDKDVLLVTVTYRLNVFGFLAMDEEILPGNLGIKDQVLALEWVKEHIVDFGGDPGNITLVGHSAGAACVQILMTLPKVKGIIKRAIIQSGSIHCSWAVNSRKDSRKFALQLASALQCPTAPAQLLQSLQRKSIQEIMRAVIDLSDRNRMRLGHSVFAPVLERPSGNEEQIESGIPMMIGVTQDEGIIFYRNLCREGDENLTFVKDHYEEMFPLSFRYKGHPQEKQITADIKTKYYGDSDININARHQFIQMTGDLCIAQGVMNSVKEHRGPVFLYTLNYRAERSLSNGFHISGICHADELFYLFPFSKNAIKIEFNEKDSKVQKLFVDLWTNFASYGNPTEKMKGVEWPEAEQGKKFVSITGQGIKMCQDFHREMKTGSLQIPPHYLLSLNNDSFE